MALSPGLGVTWGGGYCSRWSAQPRVSRVTEQPAPKSFRACPRGRLLLQVGVCSPLCHLCSLFLFPHLLGSLLSRGGAPQLPEASCGSDKMPVKGGCGVRELWWLRGRQGRCLHLGWRSGSWRGVQRVEEGARPQAASTPVPVTPSSTPGRLLLLSSAPSSLPHCGQHSGSLPPHSREGDVSSSPVYPEPALGRHPLALLPSSFLFTGLPATPMGPV